MPPLRSAMSARLACLLACLPALAQGTAAAAPVPVDAVHPAYALSEVPLPERYRTLGLAFLPDGRMVLAVGSGIPPYGDVPARSPSARVLVVSGFTGAAADVRVQSVATHWMQPTGITVVGDTVYVADRDGQYRLRELAAPADLQGNRELIVAWPDEGTWNRGRWWHQYLFTPVFQGGRFLAPYSGSIGEGGLSNVPPTSALSGAFLAWDLKGRRLEALAGGLRSPNGLGAGPGGELMFTDNQGSWFPASTFSRLKPGRSYGHRNATPNFAEDLPYQPPVAWLPHGDVRRSPTQPLCLPAGPHRGDWVMGDAFHPGLVRVAVDTVGGDFQGAVFRFSGGTGNAAINRLAWGPDGALYLGTLEKSGSLPGGGPVPLYRLAPKAGASAFEMRSVRLLADGFEIVLTEPVDPAKVVPGAFTLAQWRYVRSAGYGAGRVDDPQGTLSVTGVAVSEDGLRVHLRVRGLIPDRVVHLKASGLASAAGRPLLGGEAWYTVNALSGRAFRPGALGLRGEGGAVREEALLAAVRGGRVEARVELQGPYRLSLHRPDGALVRALAADGPGHHFLESGPGAAGVHLLVLRHRRGSLSRAVLLGEGAGILRRDR